MFDLDDMRRMLTPIRNRIFGIVGRAILTAINNTPKTQMVQVRMFGDDVFELERPQEYGFENYPDPTDENNEVLFLAISGNRGLASVVKVHNRETRPKTLTAGEVMVYSKYGQKIHLKADGSILIFPAAGKAVNLGDEGGNAVMLDTIVTKYNGHTHTDPQGGVTGVPSTLFVSETDSATNVKAKP